MPCYSTIRTKMNNVDNLVAALVALGYIVDKTPNGLGVVASQTDSYVSFTRSRTLDSFSATRGSGNLAAIGRKYAEVGVRNWAKRTGYNIVENDGVQIRLVNRRTG